MSHVKFMKKAGRRELLENEKKEINVISTFLPKQLSEEDTKKFVKKQSSQSEPHQ